MPVNFGLDQAKIHITWPKNCKKTGICLLRMHQIEINQYPETGDQHDAMLCTACFVLDAKIRGIQSVTETLALNRERGVFHSCIPPPHLLDMRRTRGNIYCTQAQKQTSGNPSSVTSYKCMAPCYIWCYQSQLLKLWRGC